MLEARLTTAVLLKKLIEALRELVTNINLECTDQGIELQAMDTSHVALVTFVLHATSFDEYRCDGPQTIGLSLEKLAKVLRAADNEDALVLRVEDRASRISLIFEGRNEDKISEFRLNMLTLDSEHLGIPETEYAAVITMPSAQFSRICKELSQLSDSLTIDVTKQRVQFSVEGEDGEGIVTLRHRETGDNKTILQVSEQIRMSYAMRYLLLFNKSSTLSDEVMISLAPSLPLVVHYQFDLGEMKYYLAPKVNES